MSKNQITILFLSYTFDSQDPKIDKIKLKGKKAHNIEKVVVMVLSLLLANKIIEKGINNIEGISTIEYIIVAVINVDFDCNFMCDCYFNCYN